MKTSWISVGMVLGMVWAMAATAVAAPDLPGSGAALEAFAGTPAVKKAPAIALGAVPPSQGIPAGPRRQQAMVPPHWRRIGPHFVVPPKGTVRAAPKSRQENRP